MQRLNLTLLLKNSNYLLIDMILRNKMTNNLLEGLISAEKDYTMYNGLLISSLKIKKSVNIDVVKDISFALGSFTLIVKGEFKKEYFERYVKLGILHFQRGVCEDAVFKFELDGVTFELNSEKDTSDRLVAQWDDLFSMTVILRNKKLTQELVNLVPYLKSVHAYDNYGIKEMELKNMCLGYTSYNTETINELRTIAGAGVVPFFTLKGVKTTKSKSNDLETIYLPVPELYNLAYNKDEVGFNSLLEQYLLHKKKWLTKKGFNDGYDFWFDFRLLGACSFAYDQGINITVESEYIPANAYRGKFV